MENEIEIEKKLITLLNNLKAYSTGSRVFEVYNSSSDYDFILHLYIKEKVKSFLLSYKIPYKYGLYSNGFKFTVNFKIYNILFLSELDLEAWKFATDVIKNNLNRIYYKKKQNYTLQRDISNKEYRVNLFESLVTAYRALRRKHESI